MKSSKKLERVVVMEAAMKILKRDSGEGWEKAERRGGERQNLPPGSRLQHPQQGTDREVWKVRLLQLLRNLHTIWNHGLPSWWAAYSRMSLLPYRLCNRWSLRLPYHQGFLEENEEEMVLGCFFNVFTHLLSLSHGGSFTFENGHKKCDS